ncbi:exopolyphosphatase PRUNE1-like [Seriola lalandi dorsalis]|uniref:exopolyphosphatase PRUNE1-like n=1 Tax=Seriola lalandi dorsalis TaxID=1841481 RepID=UPI000C6F6566|nr:exopolyphosphatase PRUNE1-like [Seriola lalandi dorsalis]XP_056237570.1 exopolyphosphatase PRUNE1 [Seriola aureovittata]
MEEFLSSCRHAAQANTDQPGPQFHVVLGNESCDVDSMVSALAFAYFLSKTELSDVLALPLLNIHQSDLLLRSDNLFLLRQTGLSPELLLFRDQLDLRALQRAGRLRLTLVDHNVLASADSDLEGAVVEVIDHHLLEREPSPSCPVTVETVGSCATLVTERIVQKAPQILDQQLAQLLYAAVVLDCVNMAPAAGKVTPKDSQYAAALETRFPALPPRGALFQALQNAKFDVSGLNTEQMLLKDMKAVSGSLNLAVSVLYITLEEFLQRAQLEAELSGFCQKFGYDLLLMMTISFTESKEPIRELAVFSHSSTCREQVSQYLEQARNPALNLCPISSPHPHVTAYQQGNVLASRKKVLPIVKDFLKEQEGDGRLGDVEEEEESGVPPTPMNSLVEGCPLDEGLPHISAQDLVEKVSKMADRGGN